jgi:hypothetical protein
MLNFEESLYNYLSNYSGIKAIVSTKIYPLITPEDTVSPFIVYTPYSQQFSHSFDNDSGYNDKYIQIDMYHTSFINLKALSKQVRKALINFKGIMGTNGITIQAVICESGDRDSFESESKFYRTTQEYKFTYLEEV